MTGTMGKINYGDFCKSKECKCFNEWDFGYGTCESCTKIGESYGIYEYPKDCLFIDEIMKHKDIC